MDSSTRISGWPGMSFPSWSLNLSDWYAWTYSVKNIPTPGTPPSRMSVRPRLSGGWLNACDGAPEIPVKTTATSNTNHPRFIISHLLDFFPIASNRLFHTYPRKIAPVNLFFWETALLPATIGPDGRRCIGVLHGPERRLRRALPGIRGPAGPFRQTPRNGAGSPCRRCRLRLRGAAASLRLRGGRVRGLRSRSGPGRPGKGETGPVSPRAPGDRRVLRRPSDRLSAGRPCSLPGQLAGPRTPGRGGALPPRRRFGHLGGWGDPPPDPQLRAPPARKRHDASSHERGGGGDRVPPELRLGGEPEGQVTDRAQVLRGRPARCREKRDPPLPSLSR